MHILIVPSWYPNEKNPIDGIFFKEQAIALQQSGHQVTVAFPDIWSINQIGKRKAKNGLSYDIEDGIPTYRYNQYNFFPRIPYGHGIIYRYGLGKIFQLIIEREGKPDIIHAHSCIYGGWAATKITEEQSIPLIITEHSSKFAMNMYRWDEKKLIKKAVDSAKKVIAVGPGLIKELSVYTKIEKLTMIPNIVNIDEFKCETKKIKTRTETISNKFRFFSLANLIPVKGFDILLKAFANVIKDNDVELVIGGNGSDREYLERLANDLNIQKNVQFLGQLSRAQVKEQLNEADGFVLATRYETFGIVFIEALACGKPVIATKSGGPEMIVNDLNGILVPVDDIHALSKAMISLIEQYSRYDQQKIRDDVVHRFGIESVVNRLEEVYNDSL